MKKQLLKLGKILPAILLWSGISAQYCIPTYTTGCTSGDDIDDFQIIGGNLNHLGSGCSTDGYGDFTGDPALTAELAAGLSYNFSATHNFGSQYIKIWIDFNGDELFDETDELLFVSTTGASNTTGSIAIPAAANPTTTRMRVMTRWNSAPTNSCTNGSGWGETHDYTVVILPPPSCLPVTDFTVLDLTSTSIELAWEDSGNGEEWDVEWGAPGFSPETGNETGASTVSDTTETITGLDPNTTYDIYVKADCGADGESVWAGPFTVTTNCAATTATYAQNFDGVSTPNIPSCWNPIAIGSNANVRCRTITGFTPNSLPNQAELYNSATVGAAEHVILVSPQFSDLPAAENQIRFFSRRGTNAVDLEIGTMSDPNDPTTFTLYETVTGLTTTHQEFTVTFDNYTGTDEYVAFRHPNTASNQYLFVDDFNWEPIPSCPWPTDLSVSNITLSSADLSWTDNAGASEWEVEWDEAGFTLGDGNNSMETSTSLSLTALDDGTTYEFYVRANCGAGEFSDWVGPFAFTTVAVGSTCGAPIVVNTLPYFDASNTADYGSNYAAADRPALGNEQYTNGTGADSYLNGDDVVYSFTPTQTGFYNFGLDNIGTWVGFWLFEGCDPFTSIVAYHTATTAVPRLLPDILLTEGETYYVVISTWPSPQSTPYELTICQSEDASFDYASQLLCELETSFVPTITGEQGGTFSSTAGLTLDPSTGEINPSTSDAGSYEVVYTTDGGICSGADTIVVEIAGIEDASFEYDANLYCILDDNALPTITGQAGGEFTAGSGLAINASTGEINPATSAPGNYTVEYTSSTTACATTESWEVEIVMNENASFSYANSEICQNHVDVSPTISGVQGGTFSAQSGLAINTQTGQIGAEASNVGTYWVYYTTPGQDCPATDSVQVTIQECLSLDENTIAQIEVYPNPARDIVNVVLPIVKGNITIEVMDATGKRVMNKTVNGNVGEEKLNIVNLEKGVYLIRFTGNEMNTTKRIVVTK
jgi:hypothetical protein